MLQVYIQSAKMGPTRGKQLKNHSFIFNPLNEPTQDQIATTREKVAKTDKIYFEIGSLSSQEIRESRFGGDEYSMETQIDNESDLEQKEADNIPLDEQDNLMNELDPDDGRPKPKPRPEVDPDLGAS